MEELLDSATVHCVEVLRMVVWLDDVELRGVGLGFVMEELLETATVHCVVVVVVVMVVVVVQIFAATLLVNAP
jgi:hypothetical protein